jgi:hypothetical protein
MSPAGDDGNPCTSAAPCRTFGRAYRAADPGEVVEVAAGSYPDHSIEPDPAKTAAADVVFRPAPGAAVVLTQPGPGPEESFVIRAAHVELRDMRIPEWRASPPGEDITMRNIDGDNFVVESEDDRAARDIRVLGGDYGPSVDDNTVIGVNGLRTTASPTDVLIDGVMFHDYTLAPGSDAHVECLQVSGVDGLTIRNSRFRDCWVFDILVGKAQGGSAPTPSRILIENNFLECCGGGDNYSLRLSDSWGSEWQNVTIRNNSSDTKISIGPGSPYANVSVTANIAPRVDGAPPGVAFSSNVWYRGSAVGPGDIVAPAGFRDAPTGDFHLVSGAAAIDRGGPTAPADDIDREARPRGQAPDAGADEAG